MNLVLSGMPGCGKSTVAKLLAQNAPYLFVDSDEEIEKEYGSIADIFARYGEEKFRDIESRIVERLSKRDNLVIATGGGCMLRGQNVAALKKSGKIFYLQVDVSELIKRLKNDTTRPLLAGDAEENLKKLYAARAAIYQDTADYIIDCNGKTPYLAAQSVLEKIK